MKIKRLRERYIIEEKNGEIEEDVVFGYMVINFDFEVKISNRCVNSWEEYEVE